MYSEVAEQAAVLWVPLKVGSSQCISECAGLGNGAVFNVLANFSSVVRVAGASHVKHPTIDESKHLL